MNVIRWSPRAARQLRKIKEAATRQRIFRQVQTLKDFPHCSGIKHLVNHRPAYRLRVGDWRVLFDFDDAARVISIEAVKKRDEQTY